VTRSLDRYYASPSRGLARLFVETPDIPASAYGAMVLSLVPGLGHLRTRRWRAGLCFLAVWAVLLLLLLSFSVGPVGALLATAVLACHAVAMFEAGRFRRYADGWRARIGLMLLISLALVCLYGGAISFVQHRWGLSLAYSPSDLPGAGIRQGDLLGFVRLAADPRRGDVVAAEAQRRWPLRNGYVAANFYRGLPLWVVALGGDRVELSTEGLRVNAQRIARDRLPAATLPLPPQSVAIEVPAGYIMVIYPMRAAALPEGARFSDFWREMSLLRQGELADRAVGIYLPLTRRRFLARSLTE
jgi:hypothetical protein